MARDRAVSTRGSPVQIVPARRAGGGHVEDIRPELSARLFVPRLSDHVRGRVREVPRPGRRSDLVGDDAELVAFAREPQDRPEEIAPAGGVDPAVRTIR